MPVAEADAAVGEVGDDPLDAAVVLRAAPGERIITRRSGESSQRFSTAPTRALSQDAPSAMLGAGPPARLRVLRGPALLSCVTSAARRPSPAVSRGGHQRGAVAQPAGNSRCPGVSVEDDGEAGEHVVKALFDSASRFLNAEAGLHGSPTS